MITYRTHNIHSEDIQKLSEQTAAACTVQEVRGKTMSSQMPSSNGADQDNANLRSDLLILETEVERIEMKKDLFFIKLKLWISANSK